MNSEQHSRVLIVDDMKVNRLILSSLLASAGVTSDLAESGMECIDLCKQHSYDLILLDHRMPELDGVDTLIQLKNIFEAQGRHIPVVCHTTEDARKNTNLYKAAGFADVIFKPIQPKELSEILMKYLPEGTLVDEEKSKEELLIEEEMSKLPDWTKNIEGLNLHSAIEHCETAQDFIETLEIFIDSIDTKATEIEHFINDSNFKMYTLRVHSLKSMSRIIGAEILADMASELEIAGKSGDTETIMKYTPLLLEKYRAFLTLRNMITDSEADTGIHLPEISAETLNDAYSAIKDFIICYDADSLNMVLDSLSEYHLSDNDKTKTKALRNALASMEWESLRAIMCM